MPGMMFHHRGGRDRDSLARCITGIKKEGDAEKKREREREREQGGVYVRRT